MKPIVRTVLLTVAISLSACTYQAAPQSFNSDGQVTLEVFYTQLSPYGMWVNYSTYGYVWIPNVSADFTPYFTSGHWVYTQYGWTWYSYYSWGWAPFHYGRWEYDITYGWMWIPDTVWGPAWVVWRMGDGYCGWAPLGPNITVNIVIGGGYAVRNEHWIFVHDRDFTRHHVYRYRVDRTGNKALVDKTSVVRHTREDRNVTYMPGPQRDDIQRSIKRSINQVEIRDRDLPGNDRLKKDRLQIYKPEIKKDTDRKIVPGRVTDLNQVKKLPEKETERTRTRRTEKITKPAPQQQPSINRPSNKGKVGKDGQEKSGTKDKRTRNR